MKEATYFNQFARYAGLSVLGTLGVSCYILADTFFVANGLGTNGLAALNLAIPAFNVIIGVALMLGMGGATRYTIAMSRGDSAQGSRIFTATAAAAAAAAALFAAAGLLLPGWLAGLLGADQDTFEMTRQYLQVVLLFAPAFTANELMLCFVRNDGAPNLAMAGMVTGSLANILLDYIFIFPMDMGIFGAALATGFSPLISLAIMSRHKVKKQNNFHLTKDLSDMKNLGRTAALGIPTFVTELSSGIVIIVFNLLILGLEGNVGVAAYGIIANISLVVIAVYNGIAQGVQPLMSQSYGGGRPEEAGLYLRYALVTAAVVSAAIYAVIFFGAGPITAVFNSENNPALAVIAEAGLKIYFMAILFAGFNIILQVYFTSREIPFPAQAISVLRGFAVIVPASYLLAETVGITGVWLSFPVTEAVVAIIGLLIYTMDKRRSLK